MNNSPSEVHLERSALLVDDDPVVQALLEQYLKFVNYSLTTTTRGAECLQFALANRPDVIFLDLIMPDCSGFDVLRQLQTNEITKTIKVILITANPSLDAMVATHGIAPDAFLYKPFDLSSLKASLQSVLG